MNRVEQLIHDNKVRIELLEELIEKYDFEINNGHIRVVLQGRIEGYKQMNENLNKE